MNQTSQTNCLSRRDTLKTLGVGALAFGAPALLTRHTRAETLGNDEHRYEWNGAWLQLPKGKSIGYTHGVVVDEDGLIYIFNQSPDALLVCDPDGKIVKAWGSEFQKGAHGLHLSKEDGQEYLYLTDYELHEVVKTDKDGKEILRLGMPQESGLYNDVSEYRPTNVAVAPNGDIYVTDGYGKSWIHQFNKNGEYLRSWGGPGAERGQLSCPHGLWIDRRGEEPLIVVADRVNVRLQYFTLDGRPRRIFNQELRYPCDFDTKDGCLLVPDLHGRVTIFNQENQLITHLGDNPEVQKQAGYPNLPHEQRQAGKFISPHAARWDREGNIFVVEWVSDGRVTKLRRVS
jgi:hypothetical protein